MNVNVALSNIELFVYDFDGVMTDNKVYIDENGKEMVLVNRSDGLAINEIKQLGIKQIIISSEKNPVVGKRAKKIGIPYYQGKNNKKNTLISFCIENQYDLNKVAFVGNDINDLDVMKLVGSRICPSDAHKNILMIADVILERKGGEGVIRELFDLILSVKD